MTMPQQQTITTTVQSLGKPKSGKGFAITLAHNWPGSKFPTILYGQDEAQIAGIGIGDPVEILVQKGSLKQGKSPDKDFNFYWDTVSITKRFSGGQAATHGSSPAPEPRSPASGAPYVPPPPVPQDVTRISIERQKAVAEAREATQFILQTHFQLNPPAEQLPWPAFREVVVPMFTELVSELATSFYRSIHGRRDE